MANNNVLDEVDVDGEFKTVISTNSLSGDVRLMALNNIHVEVDTPEGFKRAVAVVDLGGGGGGSSFPDGTVNLFADLPDYTTVLGQFYFVEEPKDSFWVKNGRGFYEASSTGWINASLKVQASMDSGTVINWSNWANYISASNGIDIKDRVIYDGIQYENQTGVETSTNPLLDLVNWKPLENLAQPRNPVQLKSTSLVDQTLTSGLIGSVVLTEVIQESNGITISNGAITFQKAGFYRIQMQLNISNANNTEIETWAESFDGSVWTGITNSGNIKDTATATATNFLIESTFVVPDDFTLRIKARTSTGSATLDYSTIDNGIGVPSVTILAYELDPAVYGINIDTANLLEPLYIGSGVNATKFEADGTMVAEGEATTFDEVSHPLFAARLDTSSGRIDYNYDELTVDFATNARYPEEPANITIQAMHSWKIGGKVRPHIHWMQNSDNNPNILVSYRVFNNGEVAPLFTLKALSISDNVFPYTLGQQQITEFNLNDSVFDGMGLSFTTDVKIYRDSQNTSGLFASADSYSGEWEVKYFDIHFEKDMNGSREEFIK